MSVERIPAVRAKSERIWFAAGVAFLAYAVLGNWFVLPGYRRFLEHGSPNAGTSGLDYALILGASKTILWMFSFHLGAFCLAVASLTAQGESIRSFRRWFMAGALAWIALWSVPTIPGPYAGFFATSGIAIMVSIVAFFTRATNTAKDCDTYRHAFGQRHWQIASYFFFALATWDICGLGSVGGILHPSDAIRGSSQSLVVAQTTKLIVELFIAWALLGFVGYRRQRT